jgi:hypothetical protein
MSLHAARTIAEALGLRAHRHIAYGEADGLFVCIEYRAFTAIMTVTATARDTAAQNAFSQYCTENARQLLIRGGPEYLPSSLTVYLDSHFGALTARRAARSARDLLARLHTLGFVSACASCSAPDASAALQEDSVQFLCDTCFDTARQRLTEDKSQRRKSGSYLSGLGGAAVGGLIGMLPWIILGLIGYISSASGLLMAWLCVRFYKKFNGRTGRPMVLIVLLALLLFSALGVFVSWIVSGLSIGYSLTASINYALSDMTLTGPIGDLIIGLLLAGFGLFFFMRGLFKSVSEKSLRITRPE